MKLGALIYTQKKPHKTAQKNRKKLPFQNGCQIIDSFHVEKVGVKFNRRSEQRNPGSKLVPTRHALECYV